MSRLEDLVKAAGNDPLPPVDRWEPPYCGDIGLEIGPDGVWYYQKSPIGRVQLVKLFSRILRRDADNGHYLVTPVEKVRVAVADAPFLAVEMQLEGEGPEQKIAFRTNVDDVVVADRDHPLRFARDDKGGGLKPYVLVRGRLEALVTRSLYYDLMERVSPRHEASADPDAPLGLWSAGVWFELKVG